ncbi:Malectin-like carbohydrate-binding domain [Sesbania bispinosa]|nr:Malectin-like carbohydrate-binding domain [Sesbania bispinosa]
MSKDPSWTKVEECAQHRTLAETQCFVAMLLNDVKFLCMTDNGEKTTMECHLKLRGMACPAFSFIAHHAIASSSKPEKHVARQLTDDNNVNPGFISIDCGSNVDYLHEETGIWYQTDKNFVETGMNHVVPPRTNLNYDYFGRQLTTLRSFPDGDRNCYTLKPKQGKNNSYLIRAFFAYGNYDFKNETPSFDLYIGVNYWDTIGFNDYYYFTEIIHTPLTDIIHVCLVKTGPTIPFISSLELRLLNSSIYQIPIMSNSTPQPQLKLETRLNFGAPSYPLHNRYKDDVYDRIWRCYEEADNKSWAPLFLDESMDTKPARKGDAYKLPAQVWRSAFKSTNVSYPLNFDLANIDGYDKSYEYVVSFHFTEIESDKKRIINITLNSENILSQPLVLEYLKPVTISPRKATQSYIRFNITATSESNASPIINALEVYKLIAQFSSPTDTRDVGAILDIKRTYHISKLTWQGDPCVPKQYAWEGINCSSDTNPRITSL